MDSEARLGQYRILEILGRGGMGQVYLAEDTRLKRRVALKVLPAELALDPQRHLRFQREAETIAALDHPNIVTLYSIEESEGIHFLTMQLVQGRTLDAVIPEGGMALDTFLALAGQLLDAVDAAHRKGITHRDLKPGNIMVGDEGRLTVLDFGLAKTETGPLPGRTAAEGDAEATRLTGLGQILGTVTYMSPEQAQGMEVDARSDIFSLGAVLTEMLTGRPPFAGDNRSAMISAILKDEPLSVAEERPDLPPRLARVVRRCLHKDREARYPSVRDLATDLDSVRRQAMGEAVAEAPLRPGPGGRDRRDRRRTGWRRAMVGGFAVALLLAAGALWQQVGGRTPAPAAEHRPIDSILALPASIFGGPELAPLAESVPRIISRGLGQIDGLSVGLPPSLEELEATGGDASRLPGADGVAAFVHTSVTAAGRDVVAINVQLVEAGTRRILWSDDYQGRVGTEAELARLAAEGIRGALGDEAAATSVAGLTMSGEAQTSLYQGKFYASRFDNLRMRSDFDVALGAFEAALRADPRLAAAAAEAAYLYQLAAEGGHPGALEAAGEWTRRALEIDPQSNDLWAARSRLEGLRAGADRSLRLEYALRAATHRPRDPRSHDVLGAALAESGYSSVLALAAFGHAADLDWMYHRPRLRQAALLLRHGRSSEAALYVDEVLRIEPGAPGALLARAWVDARAGRAAEVVGAVARLDAMAAEGRIPDTWTLPLRAAGILGDTAGAEAEGTLEAVRAIAADAAADPRRRRVALDTAMELARRGRSGDALDLLAALAADGVLPAYDTLLLSPDVEGLRGEARFAPVRAAAQERFRELLQALDQASVRGELPGYLSDELADLEPRLGSVR